MRQYLLFFVFIISVNSLSAQNITSKNISDTSLALKTNTSVTAKIVVFDSFKKLYFSNINIQDIITTKELNLQNKKIEELKTELNNEKKKTEELNKILNSLTKKVTDLEKKIK